MVKAIREAPIGGFNRARSTVVPRQTDLGLGAFGQALVGLGQDREDEQRRKDLLKTELEIARFQTSTQKRIEALDPLASDYEKQVQTIYQEERSSAVQTAGLADREVRDAFDTRLQVLSEGGTRIANTTARSARSDRAVSLFEERADELTARIRDDPDGVEAYLAEFQASANNTLQSVDPTLRPGLTEAAADEAVIAQVDGLSLQGRFDEARGVIDALEGELAPSQARSLRQFIRQREGEARADFSRSMAQSYADLEIKIRDTSDALALQKLRGRVDQLQDAGFFENNQDKRTQLVALINAKLQSVARGQKDVLGAQQQYFSGKGFNNQAQADLAFESMAPDPAEDPEAFEDFTIELSRNGGYVPTKAADVLKRADKVDNPQQIAAAAQLRDRLEAEAPNVRVDDLLAENSRVKIASTLVELYGWDYDTAAQRSIDQWPDKPTRDQRNDDFDEVFGFTQGEVFDPAEFIEGVDLEDLTPEDRIDAERSLRLNYMATGDEDLTRYKTQQWFSRTYGPSALSGGFVMKHPPERFFPGPVAALLSPDEKATIIRAEIERSLEAAGVNPGIVLGAEGLQATRRDTPQQPGPSVAQRVEREVIDQSGAEPFLLFSDGRTEKDLGATGRPSYQVRVRTEWGTLPDTYAPVRLPDDTFLRFFTLTMDDLLTNPEYIAIVREERENVRRRQEDMRRSREVESFGETGP